MENNIDNYYWDENRKILTYNEIRIKNLESIGYWRSNKATLPLDNHIHKHCFEFVVMIKGAQNYLINDEVYHITGGDVFVSFNNQLHGSGALPQDVNEIIWFKIDMNYITGFLGLCDEFGRILYNKISTINNHVIRTDEENIKLIRQSFELFSTNNIEEIAIGQSLFISFLNRLLSNKEIKMLSKEIDKTLRYINKNIYVNISMHDLSRISELSESRFKHKFKQQVGITPRDYINKQKINKSKELLRNGESITDVAFKLGFDTSNYFAVVFKRYTSYTPSQYRKNIKKF